MTEGGIGGNASGAGGVGGGTTATGAGGAGEADGGVRVGVAQPAPSAMRVTSAIARFSMIESAFYY
jgi:hypothetical protein